MALNQLVDSRDQRFVLFELLEVEKMKDKYPEYADFDKDTYEEFMNLAERIAVDKIYPAGVAGDKEGCKHDGKTKKVTIPSTYKEALDAYYESGFMGVFDDPSYGGMGMPFCVGMACNEYFSAASVP